MKRRLLSLSWIAFAVLFFGRYPVLAQETSGLDLSLSRDFGYSSGTGEIQGSFTLKATGPEDLVQVSFYLDGQVLGEDQEAPFTWKFDTDDFPLGVHTLYAVGITADGQELHSLEQRRQFVSSDVGWQAALRIALSILALVLAVMTLSFLVPSLIGSRRIKDLPPGAARNYGMIGGTICPKCRRPFGMHIWGMNLVVGKLDRCPYCGRWSLVRKASPAELRAAELAELSTGRPKPSPDLSEEDQLRKALEDSRYIDL